MKFCLGNQWENRKFAALTLCCAAAGLIFLPGASTLSAQETTGAENSAGSKATPRLPDGHPDLNGYWDTGGEAIWPW